MTAATLRTRVLRVLARTELPDGVNEDVSYVPSIAVLRLPVLCVRFWRSEYVDGLACIRQEDTPMEMEKKIMLALSKVTP